MKKVIVLSLTLLLMSARFVSAQGQANTRNNRLQDAGQRQEQALQRRSQAAERIGARITERFRNRLTLYQRFYDKLQSRRNLLASAGQDVIEVDRLLRLADTQLATVGNAYNSFEKTIENLDYDMETREIVAQMRQEISSLRQEFRQLHQLYLDVVNELATLTQE